MLRNTRTRSQKDHTQTYTTSTKRSPEEIQRASDDKRRRQAERRHERQARVIELYGDRGGRPVPDFRARSVMYGKLKKNNLKEFDFPQLLWFVCVLHEKKIRVIEEAFPVDLKNLRALATSANQNFQVVANNCKLYLIDLITAAAPSFTYTTPLPWDEDWFSSLDLQGMEAVEEALVKDKMAVGPDKTARAAKFDDICLRMSQLRDSCWDRWPHMRSGMPRSQVRGTPPPLSPRDLARAPGRAAASLS
jgi:hypothetical protein